MEQNLMKVFYHLASKKITFYIQASAENVNSSDSFCVIKSRIESCLFNKHKQTPCEIRFFWIDEDNDEIDIFNDADYQLFRNIFSKRHLHVAPVGMTTGGPNTAAVGENSAAAESKKAQIPPAAGSSDSEVHERVECDSCLMLPVIGFRYRCIQCPNYDLCQNCEAKHIHPEHMMVRMPNKNCPEVIETCINGYPNRRRHGKRSKTSCPFGKTDDYNEAGNSAGAETAEELSATNGKERYHGRRHHRRNRRNIFSSLYQMMNELAEGGGDAAATHADYAPSNFTAPPKTTTATSTSHEADVVAAAAAAAAVAAGVAAKKAAHVASEVANETVRTLAEHFTPSDLSKNTATDEEKSTKEKVDATTSPCDPEINPIPLPVIPTTSLENLVHLFDPNYVKTGIQILNNFSDMFAKMLDPLESTEVSQNQANSNLGKKSEGTSTKSSVSSNLNTVGLVKNADEETHLEKDQITEKNNEKPNIQNVPEVTIEDLFSDSENEESVSDSFVKVYTPENENSPQSLSDASTSASSLDKLKSMDFGQRHADLKEVRGASLGSVDKSTTTTIDGPSLTKSTSTSTTTNIETRAVPVYHADQRINNAVNAMMSMGFSNEGAWLTKLLESVNGNISEALDLMSASQRAENR